MASPLTEYNPEVEMFEGEQLEWSGEGGGGGLGETDEMELAAELLEVRDEQELDRFLGNLIKKVGNAVGAAVGSPIGRAVGGTLKGVLKTALPVAGGALGTLVAGPFGTAIGSSLASTAGSALGLELEGLSQEDREFEAARQFVRFAGEAVINAARSSSSDPVAAAQSATMIAARKHAPGLLRDPGSSGSARRAGPGGRWIRRGRNILVVNC
jgi:uncharacterized protein (DUF697 family)